MDADKTCEATFALNPDGDAPPTASFSYSCTGLNCSFDGSTSGDDNGIVEYYWNFGDGATALGPTAEHTYTTADTYSVTLRVTDTASQTNTVTASVRAKDKGKTKGSSGGDDGGSGSGNCPPAKAAKGKC
jgi:PKD repeat protein